MVDGRAQNALATLQHLARDRHRRGIRLLWAHPGGFRDHQRLEPFARVASLRRGTIGQHLATKGDFALPFPESVEREARKRARGTCECTRNTCPHYGGCRLPGTTYHHKKAVKAGGTDELGNCQLLCKACHDRAHSSSGGFGLI
jgi:hypothetical protein